MPLKAFHPAVARWFERSFPAGPTAAQVAAWPAIVAGNSTLVAAPTGSGKTLTAFLAAIDGLVRQGLRPGGLADETVVVYVSPLKALSNDIRLNLEAPLAGIREELASLGLPDVAIRTAVRTGDTPQHERVQSRRNPPHILVTTPESLYVLLGSLTGREMLRTVRTVIVDEIHAVAASKRGSHLALSLERLEALAGSIVAHDAAVAADAADATDATDAADADAAAGAADADAAAADTPAAADATDAVHGGRLVRIGLSATQKPIDEVARFLVGAGAVKDGKAVCAIVDIGYVKQRDLALIVPPTPLSAVMSNDQWEQVYGQLAELVALHNTTLIFVNTRRMAERAARHLAERLGHEAVAAHHGSLAKEARLDAEQRLKHGALKVLVATASLELGLDIGDVDLVCQLGSPRAIATFLQRAGRSGHAVGGTPKARLFPQSRDDLVECAALLDCVRRGELDALRIPVAPLDVLAQQILAEVACAEWDEDQLFDRFRRAWPYAALAREDYTAVVRMLADGFTTRRGTRASHVHRDAVNRRLRGRKGARLTALTSGGTIPDSGDYTVLLEPQAQTIGTVNEDFAVESLAGDVFQLGNASYRILRVEPGRVRVEDAHGTVPNIPFWLGEAPGRSDELSQGVSRLREEVARRSSGSGEDSAAAWLAGTVGLDEASVAQLLDYLLSTAAALGALPTRERIVLERFFDESGGTQLVIHSPYGSRLNRAWGLALRKRFCRKFNFELQAAATEDAIVLSLSASHSFALEDVSRYLYSSSAMAVLEQALLEAPLFGVRWRWNATTALALPRFLGGRRVAPQLQRMKSEDLLASVFPDQVACAENLAGAREVPDHPLVAQTLHDCLYDAMDAAGWLQVLRGIESGRIEVRACELTAPSAPAAEAINARPYAFLDDAPLEERRTQAVQSRRYADPKSADDLGRLDASAIDAVRREAWPQARSPDEMHELLAGIGTLTQEEVAGEPEWQQWLAALAHERRATCLSPPRPLAGTLPNAGGSLVRLWVTTENLPLLQSVFPDAAVEPVVVVPAEYAQADWRREAALLELIRARLTALGPVTAARLAQPLMLVQADVEAALLALQQEGYVMQGRFTAGAVADEWCERHLLARIHRYTLHRLRREIEPVEPRHFMRFLFDWQHLGRESRVSGPDALAAVLAQLEGYEAPAAAWEAELLAARVEDYSISWLDDLCTAGRTVWTRLRPPAIDATASPGNLSLRSTPILLLPRKHIAPWVALAPAVPAEDAISARAQRVLQHLARHGASFYDEIAHGTHLLRTELEEALSELVMRGRIHCDSYAGLRSLLVPASKRSLPAARRRRGASFSGIQDAGRWALVRRQQEAATGTSSSAAVVTAEAAATGTSPSSAVATRAATESAATEHVARALLRRYGVICWRLMEREAAWLPPWRSLVRVYHRLEARGEIRGGRFIAGLSGEQFALPEAITLLRQVRRQPTTLQWVCVSATDPANLLGTVLPGSRIPRVSGSRVLYRDGVPVGTFVAGRVEWLAALDGKEAAVANDLLMRGAGGLGGLRVDVVPNQGQDQPGRTSDRSA